MERSVVTKPEICRHCKMESSKRLAVDAREGHKEPGEAETYTRATASLLVQKSSYHTQESLLFVAMHAEARRV
jgi:hypothetical protein